MKVNRMKIKELCKKFFEFEEENSLFDWRIQDVHIWELIRFEVFASIVQELGLYGQAHTLASRTLKDKIKIFSSSMNNFIFKNPFLAPKNKIVFIGHPRRKLLNDNKYWDIYSDFFVDELQEDAVLFEPYYLDSHLKPAKTEDIYYLDFLSLCAYCYRILIRQKRNTFKGKKFAHILGDKVCLFFGIHIEKKIKKIIKSSFNVFTSNYFFYTKLFKFIQPKIILIVVSYGQRNAAIIAAAKDLKIPVVELQHGVISRYHLGYSFPGKNKKNTFPDYFFSFGDFWKSCIEFPIGKGEIFNVGYPYLDTALQKYKNSKKTNTIIVISQGTIGEKLSKFVVELKEILPSNVHIIYKLHPGEFDNWRSKYPWLFQSKVQVYDNPQAELYELLAQAKWQIGVYSTAIYEGLAFNCRTFLVDLPGIEYMGHLLASGHAKLVQKPSDIILDHQPIKINKNYFFADNWQQNFREAMQKIGRD